LIGLTYTNRKTSTQHKKVTNSHLIQLNCIQQHNTTCVLDCKVLIFLWQSHFAPCL